MSSMSSADIGLEEVEQYVLNKIYLYLNDYTYMSIMY